jgi:hypothetical protein
VLLPIEEKAKKIPFDAGSLARDASFRKIRSGFPFPDVPDSRLQNASSRKSNEQDPMPRDLWWYRKEHVTAEGKKNLREQR